MGNCLPFFSFFLGNTDELTRLDNLDESTDRIRSFSFEDETRRSSGESDDNRSSRHRYRRNLQPSSYVNELYESSVSNNRLYGNEEGFEQKLVEDKRKLRVRSLLDQIPIDKYIEGSKGDDECAICMIDFVENEGIRYLPCMHSYHVKCIDDWLLRSFTCPSCMEPVDSAILSEFTANSLDVNLATLACTPALKSSN